MELSLRGVRQNNLKEIDLDIPLGEMVVITGPSGSGKSSLAFETIYAEGQRRYVQSLSTYARQFLARHSPPDADSIENIPPTIALEQANPVRNSRATVGTSTEIYDYLRLLFEKVGRVHCSKCELPMEHLSPVDMARQCLQAKGVETLLVTFATLLPKDSLNGREVLMEHLRQGYRRILFKSQIMSISEDDFSEKAVLGKEIGIIIDRFRIGNAKKDSATENRLSEALQQALTLGNGVAKVYQYDGDTTQELFRFSQWPQCPKCHLRLPPVRAASFSFNNPLGACSLCKGFGNTLEVDESLVIPRRDLSITRGAIDPLTKPSLKHWNKKFLEFCKAEKIDTSLPYDDLPATQKEMIFEGHKKFIGVRGIFKKLNEDKYKIQTRVFINRYTSAFVCMTCHGTRLNETALRVKVAGATIADICGMNLQSIFDFIKDLKLNANEKIVVKDCLAQLNRRIATLNTVGLHYLSLSRLTRSLSGGEYQRILLATQLSQGLTDTMYVLDEPSIGLHPRDTARLISVLDRLGEQGNSLIVVEHDPELIAWANYVIDIGPGAGSRGGEVVFQGTQKRFQLSETSTALAVNQWVDSCWEWMNKKKRPIGGQVLSLSGAQENNLQNIQLDIPLRCLVTVTGVSGSGKSTLIVDTLYQALAKLLTGQSGSIGKFERLAGFEHLSAVELVDQSPIGKSSRSNPITFIKGYDEIRKVFSQTREATAKGFAPGHFSFNVPGGRCETCEGEGRVKIDMVFMEDIFIPCEDCKQKKFKPQILAVRFRGKNIDDVLNLTVEDAYDFFAGFSSLISKLGLLKDVGLGYLRLGQPAHTLSGGEAQRLKIARELSQNSLNSQHTLFILDEPTTGLHFLEIEKLIRILNRLIEAGHSVITIEHNIQLISASDYLIDLGPEAGAEGGRVVASGTPLDLTRLEKKYTGQYLANLFRAQLSQTVTDVRN